MRLLRILLFLLISFSIHASPLLRGRTQQLPEHGEIAELKDKRKVYVTADHSDARERIVKELGKYKGLEVVNQPGEADFWLSYSVKEETAEYLISQLTASMRLGDGRERILWTEKESSDGSYGFGKPNSVNLTRHFIKKLKRVRGEK